jgi:hypothetical protein
MCYKNNYTFSDSSLGAMAGIDFRWPPHYTGGPNPPHIYPEVSNHYNVTLKVTNGGCQIYYQTDQC